MKWNHFLGPWTSWMTPARCWCLTSQVVYHHVYTREQPYDCEVGYEDGTGKLGSSNVWHMQAEVQLPSTATFVAQAEA